MADDDAPDQEHEHEHGGNEVPAAQEDRIVDKVVNKVRDLFDEIAGPGSGAESGRTESPRSTAPPGPAATEADMERKVKEGVAKEITARERKTERERINAEHEAEHERIRALTEEPPKVFSRLTTAIWGDGDS